MGKPEIIGYQIDPERRWSVPRMPDITYDSDGIQIPCIGIDNHGEPFETTRYLGDDEIDGFMRHHGMKRVYKPREFRAKPAYGGYRIHCKTCGTTTLTSGYLPHDSARMHAEREHRQPTDWPLAW
jgi:hypothetical protein